MHNISCWMEISPHKGSTLRKSRQSSYNYRILEITQWIHKICSLKIPKPIIDTKKTIVKIITSRVAWCGPTQSVSISVPGPWIYNKPIIRDTHKKKLKKPHFLVNIPEEFLSLQFSSQSSGQRYATALLAHFKPVTCKNLLKHRELESEHTVSHWAWETKLQHNQNLHYKYTLWNPNCSQIDTGENISCPYPFSQFREEKIPLADMNQMWKSLHWVPEPAAHWNPCSYLFASTVTSQSVATKPNSSLRIHVTHESHCSSSALNTETKSPIPDLWVVVMPSFLWREWFTVFKLQTQIQNKAMTYSIKIIQTQFYRKHGMIGNMKKRNKAKI